MKRMRKAKVTGSQAQRMGGAWVGPSSSAGILMRDEAKKEW